MVVWDPPIRDYQFLYHELLPTIETVQRLGYSDFDADFLDSLMEGWATHCEEVWLPINMLGDRKGLKFEDGKITMPPEFKDAYRQGIDEGWLSTACEPEHGGMGVPLFFQAVFWAELGTSSCMSMSVLPALSIGVYEVLIKHGRQDLIDHFATNLASGIWSGTMCLTEPHSGTDLGIIETKAIPQEDGSYQISGSKCFITYGEHDMAENIVHLVLAKAPGGGEGTRGISLFLVPKFLPDDWKSGGLEGISHTLSSEHNGVICSGTEEKMGLHASPTCVMSFEESTGWLVGPLHGGMPLMFEMMNRERLATGLMAVGLSQAAYVNSLAWARERRQGRSLKGVQDPHEMADNILVHPDVRRMLLEAKVNNEGCRALAAWIGLLLDQMHSDDPEEAEMATALVALFTPIAKAHFTDLGCETCSTAMQVMGGAGYISEYGVEQFYRDVRISKIWEGTNGIQALDLAGRKITQDFGKNLRYLMWPLTEFIEENRDTPGMAEFNKPLHQGTRGLQQLTLLMIAEGMANPDFLAAGATDYCRYMSNILLGYMWAKMAKICLEKKGEPFYDAKLASARFFFKRIYPETAGLAAKIQSGPKSLMDYPTEMM